MQESNLREAALAEPPDSRELADRHLDGLVEERELARQGNEPPTRVHRRL